MIFREKLPSLLIIAETMIFVSTTIFCMLRTFYFYAIIYDSKKTAKNEME
jgi:hypothetical protein